MRFHNVFRVGGSEHAFRPINKIINSNSNSFPKSTLDGF